MDSVVPISVVAGVGVPAGDDVGDGEEDAVPTIPFSDGAPTTCGPPWPPQAVTDNSSAHRTTTHLMTCPSVSGDLSILV